MASLPEIEQFAHDHVFLGAAHDDNARRTVWVVVLTSVMMVGEIIAGWLTGSMALLADGFHMATHAGALGIAAGAYSYAKRHATSARFSFGTGKVGDLAGFASALVLGLVALGIGTTSVLRLIDPVQVAFDEAALVAVVGLGVNILSAILLSGGSHQGHGHARSHGHVHDHDPHEGHGRQAQDNNLRSAYLHVLADALTSVLAIVALLAGRYLGWAWMDPAMGIVGAIVIARWSWILMRDTGAVLLDTTDDHVAAQVRECVEGPGDARIADLHVWRIGPEAHAAIVSVVVRRGTDANAIRTRLATVHGLAHVTTECRADPSMSP